MRGRTGHRCAIFECGPVAKSRASAIVWPAHGVHATISGGAANDCHRERPHAVGGSFTVRNPARSARSNFKFWGAGELANSSVDFSKSRMASTRRAGVAVERNDGRLGASEGTRSVEIVVPVAVNERAERKDSDHIGFRFSPWPSSWQSWLAS
jgi:hypothetical protein